MISMVEVMKVSFTKSHWPLHSVGSVVVPAAWKIWYTLVDTEDVEEIIQSHLILGRPVERLQLA